MTNRILFVYIVTFYAFFKAFLQGLIYAQCLKSLKKSHFRYYQEDSDEDLSLVHVYFADLKMSRYITDELFSWQDILAAFGGLVGLCTGFSFLSAAEIVYFFSLRCLLPICRRPGQQRLHPSNSDHVVMVKVEN